MSEVYTFHRGRFFYPLGLENDEEACRNADCNPGTTEVVREGAERITVWKNGEWLSPRKQ